MIAQTTATVDIDGRLAALRCEPPLTLRQIDDDDPGSCALCLVGTAAGPLAGDHLSLTLEIRPSARASLVSTGASIAQGREDATSTIRVRADVGDGAQLRADPGPLIVCAGARADVSIDIALGSDCTIEWRELIVLGRAAEAPGTATLHWDVTRLGRPVLRQHVDLVDPVLTRWPGLMAGGRVLACALIADPSMRAATIVAAPAAVAQRLDDATMLVTVLAADTASATRDLAALCDRVRAEAIPLPASSF